MGVFTYCFVKESQYLPIRLTLLYSLDTEEIRQKGKLLQIFLRPQVCLWLIIICCL